MADGISGIAFALAQVLNVTVFEMVPGVPAFTHEQELWIFIDSVNITSPEHITQFPQDLPGIKTPPVISAVYYVLLNWRPQIQGRGANEAEKVPLQLGLSAVTRAFALRKLLDLPATFERSQRALISEAMLPLDVLGAAPIAMRLKREGEACYPNASARLKELVSSPTRDSNGLIFIEAEAGRGKTILLASVAFKMQEAAESKLPIYIPLRKLPLESGIAWENITQLIGIVGDGSERLVLAVKAGLVALFLDGIDEVAGRYDKGLIAELLAIMTERLHSESSAVVLSGRKTEARHLDPSQWNTYSIELPELDTNDFRTYAGSIFDGLVKQQRDNRAGIPIAYEELMGTHLADEQVARERGEIIQWIIDVFPVIAQEPSLFFVQGLAAIAIGRRAGNHAPLRSPDGKLNVPAVRDVCLIAAIYACLRECKKIDPVAEKEYTVEGQMNVLQGLAAISSAPVLNLAPTPFELIPTAFNVDPMQSPEINVAIVRQNAKHALLYATEAAGSYRPQFLNDWIRCALLAELIWCARPIGRLSHSEALKLAVSATRAKYTFELLLPSTLGDAAIPTGWTDALEAAVLEGIESASANQWILRAAVGDDRLGVKVQNPLQLAELTDQEFVGFTIGQELSGNHYLLDGTRFVNSSISGCSLSEVSMQGVVFSNCEISELSLIGCDGPLVFDDCTIANLTIDNMVSRSKPAIHFKGCIFLGVSNSIRQMTSAYGDHEYAAVATFSDCETEGSPDDLLQGDWKGIGRPDGITRKEVQTVPHRGEACLHRALRAFFPSHVGSGSTPQARPYIRLSALGRGSMPAGSPGQEQLQQIFESVGFTTGGRSDHLYGPWSGVVGASAEGIALRNELVDFLLDRHKQSDTVKRLIAKVESYFPTSN